MELFCLDVLLFLLVKMNKNDWDSLQFDSS